MSKQEKPLYTLVTLEPKDRAGKPRPAPVPERVWAGGVRAPAKYAQLEGCAGWAGRVRGAPHGHLIAEKAEGGDKIYFLVYCYIYLEEITHGQ